MRPLKLILAAVLLATIGCGGGDEPGDELIGAWLFSDANGDGAAGIEFKGDHTYVGQTIQVTSNTTALDEAEKGTYSVAGKMVTLTPTHSTCPGPASADTLTYNVSGATLALSDGITALTFSRNTSTGASNIAITFGCFAADGTFTPRALSPL